MKDIWGELVATIAFTLAALPLIAWLLWRLGYENKPLNLILISSVIGVTYAVGVARGRYRERRGPKGPWGYELPPEHERHE